MVMTSLWYKKCVYMDFRLAAYVCTTLCWSSDKLRLFWSHCSSGLLCLSAAPLAPSGVKLLREVTDRRPREMCRTRTTRFSCSPVLHPQTWRVCFSSCLSHYWQCQPALSLSWLLAGSLQNAAHADSSLSGSFYLFIYLSICGTGHKESHQTQMSRAIFCGPGWQRVGAAEEGGKEDRLWACETPQENRYAHRCPRLT